jgi:hypothetical protein
VACCASIYFYSLHTAIPLFLHIKQYTNKEELIDKFLFVAEHNNACRGLAGQEAEDCLLELEGWCRSGVSGHRCQNVQILQL